MAIGNRIKQRLEDLEWTRQQLMDAVPDLTPQALSNLITRDSKRSEWDVAIARALKVPVMWLVYGDEAYQAEAQATCLPVADSVNSLIDQIGIVARTLSLEGQAVLLGRAEELAVRYPARKNKRA